MTKKNTANQLALRGLKKGMKLRAFPGDAYGGQTMTVTKVHKDTLNPANSLVDLKLEKKVHRKKHSQPRLWWVMEHTRVVSTTKKRSKRS